MKKKKLFSSAREETKRARDRIKEQTQSLAFLDNDFLLREELRSVRLQLELLKPELIQQEYDIDSTIVVFGSARIVERAEAQKRVDVAAQALKESPDDKRLKISLKQAESILEKSHYYDYARQFARLVADENRNRSTMRGVIMTGGGPGIMEAANRGAHDQKAKNVGLSIVLPMEEGTNPYVTDHLAFQFHYFAIRKMHFLIRAQALVAFPGGFGTLDELFETLTLMQTKKIKRIPIILFGKKYWHRIINFDALVEEGVVSAEDLDLFTYVETPEQAWQVITDFYNE